MSVRRVRVLAGVCLACLALANAALAQGGADKAREPESGKQSRTAAVTEPTVLVPTAMGPTTREETGGEEPEAEVGEGTGDQIDVEELERRIDILADELERLRSGEAEREGVRLFFIEDFSPYSWALLPADASPQWPFREGHQAGQRVPASFRQPAEPRHGAEHLRSSPRQARSLLDIRAAFWYGAVGREADLRWL